VAEVQVLRLHVLGWVKWLGSHFQRPLGLGRLTLEARGWRLEAGGSAAGVLLETDTCYVKSSRGGVT
jgi:hypothetical protein